MISRRRKVGRYSSLECLSELRGYELLVHCIICLIYRFGQKRAKSSDSGRLSAMNERKTPTDLRQTPTTELRDTGDKEAAAGWAEEEAKAKLVAEQARIQQHYKRLVQQRKDHEQERGDLVDEVYQGGHQGGHHGGHQGHHAKERHETKEALPASLAAARPGSRSGITGTPTDPRFSNYNDEIQRHLSRRQAQYHSQVVTPASNA